MGSKFLYWFKAAALRAAAGGPALARQPGMRLWRPVPAGSSSAPPHRTEHPPNRTHSRPLMRAAACHFAAGPTASGLLRLSPALRWLSALWSIHGCAVQET